MTKLTSAQKILLAVAQGDTYNSEYAGRTYTFCVHCGADIDQDLCADDCLSLQARAELGDLWFKYEAEQTKLVLAEGKALESNTIRPSLSNATVECELCGVTVSEQGLKHHQKSKRCQRRRTATANRFGTDYAETLLRLSGQQR